MKIDNVVAGGNRRSRWAGNPSSRISSNPGLVSSLKNSYEWMSSVNRSSWRCCNRFAPCLSCIVAGDHHGPSVWVVPTVCPVASYSNKIRKLAVLTGKRIAKVSAIHLRPLIGRSFSLNEITFENLSNYLRPLVGPPPAPGPNGTLRLRLSSNAWPTKRTADREVWNLYLCQHINKVTPINFRTEEIEKITIK